MRQIRKLLAMIIAIMACVLICPAGIWADVDICPNSETREHEWIYYNPADCTSDGYASWQCIYCYKVRDSEYVPPLGHDYIVEETVPATCETSGVMMYTCTRCGDSWRDTIPALGHNWDAGAVTQQATCTENGVYTYTCYNCHETRSESIPATDHAWDDGVVTREPEGFEPGIKTYTCYHCGMTWEETISPAKNLFSKLRNNPPPAGMGPDPLAILENPQGGAVARGSGSQYPMTLTISVQATGGVEPYSYEWHQRSTALDEEMDEEKIAGITGATEEILKALVDGYQWAMESWGAAWTYLYQRIHGEIPESAVTEIPAGNQKLWDLLSVNDQVYEGAYYNKPTLTGSGGHTYYCVVTDAVGQKVVSELAEVRNAISIRTDYGNLNKNMFFGNKGLFCDAIDGADPWTYQWYMDDGSEEGALLEGMTASMLTVPSSGQYYCIVTDAFADTARTKTYNMYTAEPFRIIAATLDSTIREGESTELELWVTGGVLPYTCDVWYVDDEGYQNLGSLEGAPVQDEANQGMYCYQLPADKAGTYWFYLEDAMGETLEEPLAVNYHQLLIKTQPEGGILPMEGGFDLSVEMEEGTEPFTYELYWMELGWEQDGFVNGDLVEESDQNTMTVTDVGTYYFIIRDADGRWARSDFARVEPYELKLAISQTSDELTSKYTSIIFVAKTFYGEEPYTYEWTRYDEKAGEFVPLNGVEDPMARVTWEGTYLEIKKPGLYTCNVTDANGAEACWMKQIPYTGTKPKIILEPQDIMIPYSTALPTTDLVCEAISGSGDDSGLLYAWEKKTATGWEPFDSGDTLTLVEDETLEGQISGSYRCIVTDQITGESTTSEEANVSVELVCRWSGQTDGSTVIFEFEGGKAPYRMHYSMFIYVPQDNGGSPYRHAYKIGHETVYDPRDLTFTFENVNKYTKIKADKDYFFRVTVTDANGQECEEEIPYVWYK